MGSSTSRFGDDGLGTFELTRLHSFVKQLFEFGAERDIHQVTSLETYSTTIVGLGRMRTVARQDRKRSRETCPPYSTPPIVIGVRIKLPTARGERSGLAKLGLTLGLK